MSRRRRDRDGSVMIIVLLVLAAAAYLVMESGKFLRVDYEGAAFMRTNVVGSNLLDSGLVIASELLLEDTRDGKDNADFQYEDWAEAEAFYANISNRLASGDIEGTITAEDGKINLNYLKDVKQGEIFVRLLNGLLAAHDIEGKPNVFLTSIRIWLGNKDNQQDGQWYASQELAYVRRAGPFKSPHELMLVRWKGVSDENKRKVMYGADGIPPLTDFVTVWGEGKINMNLAPKELVAATCPTTGVRDEYVSRIMRYRRNKTNLFSGKWFTEIAESVGVKMSEYPLEALGCESDYFRVNLTARVGAGVIHSTTILKRDTKECVVMFENIH